MSSAYNSYNAYHRPTLNHRSSSNQNQTPIQQQIHSPRLPLSGPHSAAGPSSFQKQPIKKSNRPPPLNISTPTPLGIGTPLASSSSDENDDSYRLDMSNLYLADTPTSSHGSQASFSSTQSTQSHTAPLQLHINNNPSPKVSVSHHVIQQRSTPMISSKPKPFLNSRSLQRRNRKQLMLADPIETNNKHNQPNNRNLNLDLNRSNSSSNPNSPSQNFHYKDPDKKSSTDEFIQNVNSLELGLEYQLPIKADELVLLKKLGAGQGGTVSKVLHLPTQKSMARKIIPIDAKEVIQSQIIRELRIMHECDSPYIIGFYGAFIHESDVVICMEYVDCGSLDYIFKLTGPFPEFMLKHTAHSVLSGLIYLYDNHRIIHRDVKPSNVLLDSKGNMKLCDFGVSRELINSMADTFVGTSTYMSPERIQGGVYSVKGDVWSLGVMLYELASVCA
ncbi:unnamed protein product [Ambrosiozyma monospora]|uniref:Unnamed protein product n=1 Tax=Ambrosiozyma monospora TaxID=43982 RepID=A0ACB5TVA4_AMBMO|nr:unnamed protein product [Ambrosiozyma monospora]